MKIQTKASKETRGKFPSPLALFAPPPKLTVSEWADTHRQLSAGASAEPGQWRTSRAEYQRGIMDAVSDAEVEEVVLMTSAQVGKSESLLNILGYHIHQDPCPVMMVQPRVDDVKKFSKNRIGPMLRDTPVLAGKMSGKTGRDNHDTLHEKIFPGGRLIMVGANAPAGLAGDPIRIVLADEVDRFPTSAGDEGDPISLARKRTTTFANRLVMMVSTPTIKGISRIEAAFEETDKRLYYVPCKDCGEHQTLKWDQVKWDQDSFDPDSAYYACEHCGSVWSDADRWKAIREGHWRATADFKGRAGFHLNEMCSPWRRLSEIVRDFLEAKKSPDTLKTWVNTTLGETWDADQGMEIDGDELLNRVEPIDADMLPNEVVMVTAGVDVQDDRLERVVWGWGPDEEAFRIGLDVLRGDPGSPELWNDLADMIKGDRFTREDGRVLRIEATAVDSGGHYTDMVYRFAKHHKKFGVYAIKGRGGPHPIWPKKASKSKKRNVELFLIGVDTAKEAIYARLSRVKEPGPAYIHLDETFDEERAFQLTGEKIITKMVRGRPVREWKAKRDRVEELDCLVYAYAALLSQGRDLSYRFERWQTPVEAAPEPEPEPESVSVMQPQNHKPKTVRRRPGGFAQSWRK